MKTGNSYGSASIPSFSDRTQNKVGLNSSTVGNISDRESGSARSKKSRVRRTSNGSIKPMKTMSKKSKNMDFTDYTYREAVSRLKYLLAESYTAPPKTFGKHLLDDSGDDTDNLSVGSKALDRPTLSEISKYLSPSYRGPRSVNHIRKMKPFPTLSKENLSVPTYTTASDYLAGPPVVPQQDGVQAPPEILNFIEKQEDYIEQLEKESKFCRNELSNLLGKVKDVITENEALTEHARSDLAGLEDKFMSASSESDDNYEKFHKKKERTPRHQLSGPNIVFESRISELEAELAQANIDLKKLRAENDELKRHTAFCSKDSSSVEAMRKQIENLQRDKIQLEDQIRRLEHTIDDLKTENRVCSTKRQRDMADMALYERSQAEIEVKHLREELERQHERVRELQHEMARRVSEERANAERRYNYQVDQLGGDLTNQWEQVSKLQMEVERGKRLEADLKRDVSQKNAQIEELKMELKAKRSSFLSDIAQVNAEKQSLEQEITSLRLQLERADRQSKIEAARLTAEINSLRQRLDRADADVLHAKRENLRLSDEIANLEKEVALGDMKNEVHPSKRDINKSITEMQEKHASTVNELEEMITSQRQLMDKLTNECKTLTNKLEDTTLKHNDEKKELRLTNVMLMDRLRQIWSSYKDLSKTVRALNRTSSDTESSREEHYPFQHPLTMIPHPQAQLVDPQFQKQEETHPQFQVPFPMTTKVPLTLENPSMSQQTLPQQMSPTKTTILETTKIKRTTSPNGTSNLDRIAFHQSSDLYQQLNPENLSTAASTAQEMANNSRTQCKTTPITITNIKGMERDMISSNTRAGNTGATTINSTAERDSNMKTMAKTTNKCTSPMETFTAKNSNLNNIPSQQLDQYQCSRQLVRCQSSPNHYQGQFNLNNIPQQQLSQPQSQSQSQRLHQAPFQPLSHPHSHSLALQRSLPQSQQSQSHLWQPSHRRDLFLQQRNHPQDHPHPQQQFPQPSKAEVNRDRAAALWGCQANEGEEELGDLDQGFCRNSPPRRTRECLALQKISEADINPYDLIPECGISSPSLFDKTTTDSGDESDSNLSFSPMTAIQKLS